MSQQALIDKILAAANTEAEAIEADALKRARESAEIILAAGHKSSISTVAMANAAAAENIKTAKLMSELERRKLVLGAKREVISAVYKSALDRLCSLGFEQWRKLIYSLVTNNAPAADITLVVPSSDTKKYTQEFLTSLENGIKQKLGVAASVRLSPDPADFRGGVRMISEFSDTDASFETLITMNAEQSEYEVSQILFDE